MSEDAYRNSALHSAASANEYAIKTAEWASKAAEMAGIAEAAAGIAQGHTGNVGGLRCRVQIRIGNRRIAYSSASHASEALAAEYAHCRFSSYAKEGENISITAHAAPMKGEVQ